MSGLYEVNLTPEHVNVKCPNCTRCANFVHAKAVRIRRNDLKGYFEISNVFEIFRDFQDGWKSLAVYYSLLNNTAFELIDDIPSEYRHADWCRANWLVRDPVFLDGVINCYHCGYSRKHKLAWPEQAYFQIEYRSSILWAYNRDYLVELIDYLGSKERDRSRYKNGIYFFRIPKNFLAAKARDSLVKTLAKSLEETA